MEIKISVQEEIFLPIREGAIAVIVINLEEATDTSPEVVAEIDTSPEATVTGISPEVVVGIDTSPEVIVTDTNHNQEAAAVIVISHNQEVAVVIGTSQEAMRVEVIRTEIDLMVIINMEVPSIAGIMIPETVMTQGIMTIKKITDHILPAHTMTLTDSKASVCE